MKDEWWIDGPPEEGAVHVLVEFQDEEERPPYQVFFYETDPFPVSFATGAFRVRHCPMMPRREADEMARDAWTDAADWRYEDAGFAEWLVEWRERRAGTFGNEARDIEDLERRGSP